MSSYMHDTKAVVSRVQYIVGASGTTAATLQAVYTILHQYDDSVNLRFQ